MVPSLNTSYKSGHFNVFIKGLCLPCHICSNQQDTTKQKSFSIFLEDHTDSICDLPSVTLFQKTVFVDFFLDHFARNHHKVNTTRVHDSRWPVETFVGIPMVWQTLPSFHLPPLSHILLSLPTMIHRLNPILLSLVRQGESFLVPWFREYCTTIGSLESCTTRLSDL